MVMAAESSPDTASSVYRLDHRPGLRMFGMRFMLAAVLVVAAWLCAGLFESGAGRVVALVLGGLAALIVIGSILRLIRPPVVVRLDSEGYSLGRVPQGGVRRARWSDVTQVTSARTEHGQSLVLSVGERSSTVPLLLVAARAYELQRDINRRLNDAHGYRRLD